ncbi:MAG: cation-translocating P-type ATPase [Candidatus Paceibacterota bacterium]|jgi:Cd2+/Zn2+-exporting ATPase
MAKKHYHKHYHRSSTFSLTGNSFYFWFDLFLIIASIAVLLLDLFHVYTVDIDTVVLIIVSIIGVLPVLYSAIKALLSRKITVDLLASIALIFALLAREWHSAVFISLMLASARLFARYTENQARQSIKSLLKLRPERIHIRAGDKIIEVGINEIKVGDLAIVEAGERIAVDGEIVSGNASIDQSSLTGESEPITKTIGDEVLSSTLNLSGSIIVKAKKVGKDTTFSKILELVEKSQSGKAPISSIVERFSGWYIFFTLVGAALLLSFSHNLTLVLSVLLVTCADDLAVAVPLAFTAAIGTAAKRGIIVKGGSFIEGITKIKTMVFDKTGTITEGRPSIQKVVTFKDYPEKDFLAVLGAIENVSTHPAAKAIYQFVRQKNIELPSFTSLEEWPGYGIEAVIDGKKIFAGKLSFLEKKDIIFSNEERKIIDQEKNQGRTVTILGINQEAIGFVSLADTIKPHAIHMLADLERNGVDRLIMLTGDNEKVAEEIAKISHIPEFHANLMPEDKISFLKKLIGPKRKVAMVGDGVNDAAALALADVGIAMGAIGSDSAIETADVVLMKDNLFNIPDLMDLSRYTMKVVRQDLIIWGATNLVGLALVFLHFLTPTGAATFNFLTDFLPLFNSLKLFRLHLHTKPIKTLLG